MTIVTANSRLARSLRRGDDLAHERNGDRVWEPRDILPWNTWLTRLWTEALYEGRQERLLLGRVQELVLWEQVIAASPAGSELLDPVGAAQLAAEARDLMYTWHLPQNPVEFQGIPDAEAFRGWMQIFEKTLRQQGFITAAELPHELSRQEHSGFISYTGFDDPTPAQRQLFGTVGAILLLEASPTDEPRVRRVTLPSASEELLAAATWARRQLEEKPGTSLGVVIPDLASRRDAVHRTFADVLGGSSAFHISAPAALADTPLVSSALLVLRLLQGLSVDEYGLLLRSPYFRYTAGEGAKADLALRNLGVVRATLDQRTLGVLFPRLAPVIAETPRVQRPSGWSRSFSKLVGASGWPGARSLNSGEYQAMESWRDLLGEFAKLDAVLGETSFPEALQRLESLAADTGFGAADEDEPVQILGVLEAAGTRFDALWVAGLEDGAWPPGARPNPFLPISLQRTAGTPGSSAEQQAAYAERVTERLLAAAPEVTCSYPARAGEELLRVSPLIQALPEMPFDSPWEQVMPVKLEVVRKDAAPPLESHAVQRGGMRVIADQAACPFRAFARYRLRAKHLEDVEPGLTPRERGDVTHKALEFLWGAVKSKQALLAMDASELRTLTRSCIREALQAGLGMESRKLTKMQELEERRLLKILGEWLELEKTRPDFEVVSQEASCKLELGGFRLEIKTDRVDRYCADGTLAIIDYKTGLSSTTKDWEGDRLKAPQVPLYCVASGSKVSTAAFAQLAAGKIQLIGFSDRAEPRLYPAKEGTLPELVEGWRTTLEGLGREFMAGEARVDPAKGKTTCDSCDLQALCRVSANVPEEEEVDE